MTCWARYLLLAVVAVLGIGQMVAACGQKGDLYLPEPKPAAAPAAPAPPAPGDAESAESRD
jgi:predicted small lipoprotein YifL